MAKTAPHLRYSCLALSARQLERQQNAKSQSESLSLYQEAIHLLLPELESKTTPVIASCVILCVLEMLSCMDIFSHYLFKLDINTQQVTPRSGDDIWTDVRTSYKQLVLMASPERRSKLYSGVLHAWVGHSRLEYVLTLMNFRCLRWSYIGGRNYHPTPQLETTKHER